MNDMNAYIEPVDIELSMFYISQLSRGIAHGPFFSPVNGVLDPVPPYIREREGTSSTLKEEGINAREWIIDNYDIAAGAFGLISVMTDIIGRAIEDSSTKESTK